jgi:flagellin-like hook-associated protein FlgL
MKKLKIILLFLTIAITVTPIVIEVLLYRDNLLDLIIPPEIANIVNNKNNNSNEKSINGNNLLNPEFELPKPIGDPQYNPETKTISYTFNFTNPLQTPLEIDELQTGLVSHNDGFFLGNITISKPLKLDPGQTVDITALGILSDDAIDYLKSQSATQNSINLDFVNLNVDLSGVQLQLDKQNIGNIPIPPQILT